MTLINAGVLIAATLTGAAVGAVLGHKAGSYAVWRVVTAQLGR